MDVVMGQHLPYITCYLLINLSFQIENKWRGQNFLYCSDRHWKNRDLNPQLKKRCGLCSISKIYLQCFSDQNLCFDGNLRQLAPINLALVNVKEEGCHAE